MAAGCTAKHLMRDESFKKGWTWDLHPCVKEQGRLHGKPVWTGKLRLSSYHAGPVGFDGKISNGLGQVLAPDVRWILHVLLVAQRRGGGGGMHLAAVPAGRSARGVLAMQAGLSGAAQLPH